MQHMFVCLHAIIGIFYINKVINKQLWGSSHLIMLTQLAVTCSGER